MTNILNLSNEEIVDAFSAKPKDLQRLLLNAADNATTEQGRIRALLAAELLDMDEDGALDLSAWSTAQLFVIAELSYAAAYPCS